MTQYYLFVFLILSVYTQAEELRSGMTEILGVEQGLSQNSVNSIYKDKEGYIWIGTGDGLNRYDGHQFKIYRNTQKEKAPLSNLIRGNILEDSQGNIWYATESGFYSVNKYSDQPTERLSLKKTGNTYLEFFPRLIIHDTIWFTCASKGIGYYAIHQNLLGFYQWPENKKSETPFNIRLSQRMPYLWFISVDRKKIFAFNCRSKKYSLNRTFNEEIMYFSPETSGDYFIRTKQNIYTYSDKEPTLKNVFSERFTSIDGLVNGMIYDKSNRLWISTADKGLWMLNKNTSEKNRYKIQKQLQGISPSHLITVLYSDRDSMLWIGTDGSGLIRIDLRSPLFKIFPEAIKEGESQMDYFVKSIHEEDSGNIWIGTFQNGILIINKKGKILKTIRKIGNIPVKQVRHIYEDWKKQVWLSTDAGLFTNSPSKNIFNRISEDEPANKEGSGIFVNRILQIKENEYVCGTNSGLHIIIKDRNGGYHLKRTRGVEDLLPEKINDLWLTENRRLFLSAPPFGIFEVGISGASYKVLKKHLEGFHTRALHGDVKNKGILWVATANGIVKLNTKTGEYKLFDSKNGMSNESCYAVLPDELNNLWISTNNGICLLNTKTETFRHFSKKAGLQSAEFNSGAYHIGKTGTIFFGGINGINWFNPRNAYLPRLNPPVSLSELRINDVPSLKRIDKKKQQVLQLSYRENNINFIFSILDFTNEKSVQLKYILHGWDVKPTITNHGEIIYHNLSPGKYQLEYSVANTQDGVVNSQQLNFEIHPPFWKTDWFLLLFIVSGILLLYALIRNIEKKKINEAKNALEKQRLLSEERMRISAEMHDDIGAGLTRISLMSETGLNSENNHKKILANIQDTTSKLVENMGQIIWSLSDESKTTEDVLAYIREMVSHQVEFSHLKAHFLFEVNQRSQYIPQDVCRNLLLTVKELVNNSIKYSQGKNLRLQIIIIDKTLTVFFNDDGTGLPKDDMKMGQGLLNIKKRTRKSGGVCHFWNENGARFKMTIPLN